MTAADADKLTAADVVPDKAAEEENKKEGGGLTVTN